MRTDILRDLANRLESGEIPPETFDMSHYVTVSGSDVDEDRTDAMIAASRVGNWCGTTACIAGHLALRYGTPQDIAELRDGVVSIKRTAMSVLGVDFYDSKSREGRALQRMFGGEWDTVDEMETDVWAATPQMAAREMRELADRADRGEFL